MENTVYSIETNLRDDLGLKLALEHTQNYTQGKGDPKSPDFIPGKVSGKLETKLRVGKIKLPVAHISLHPSMEQALPMYAAQVRREIEKWEGKEIPMKPTSISGFEDFAKAILLERQQQGFYGPDNQKTS